MTINEKSYMQISRALDEYDDYEQITIQDLALHANTSTATIVRFCKKEGYESFKDFKSNLIKQCNNESIQGMLMTMLSDDLLTEELKKLEQINLYNYPMIYLYCKPEYGLICRQFIVLLNQIGINVIMLYEEKELQKVNAEALIITVGPLPKDAYNPEINYLEISFDRLDHKFASNMCRINLRSPIYNNYQVYNLNYRIFAINTLMFILIEKTTKLTQE